MKFMEVEVDRLQQPWHLAFGHFELLASKRSGCLLCKTRSKECGPDLKMWLPTGIDVMCQSPAGWATYNQDLKNLLAEKHCDWASVVDSVPFLRLFLLPAR